MLRKWELVIFVQLSPLYPHKNFNNIKATLYNEKKLGSFFLYLGLTLKEYADIDYAHYPSLR